MDHDLIQQQLSSYLDGELESTLVPIIESHLDNCATCKQDLKNWRETTSFLSRSNEIKAPPFFTEKLLARIKDEKRVSTQKSHPLLRWLAPIFVAGFASFIISIGLTQSIELSVLDPLAIGEPNQDVLQDDQLNISPNDILWEAL